MPVEHVETMRQIIEAFEAREWERIRELLDPGFEYHTSDQFPEGAEIYEGPDAMMRVRAFLDEAWADAHIELREAIPVGDAVFVALSGRLRARRAGVVMPDHRFFQVWTFRGRRPVAARSFEERADALNAAALQA
jgi:hypothetical protein